MPDTTSGANNQKEQQMNRTIARAIFLLVELILFTLAFNLVMIALTKFIRSRRSVRVEFLHSYPELPGPSH
jgi:hypothetical protein